MVYWYFDKITQNRMLNNSREHNPYSKADSRSAGQEISKILWNTHFHYRVHKRSLMVPIFSPMNPVHIVTSFFFCNSKLYIYGINSVWKICLNSSVELYSRFIQLRNIPYRNTGFKLAVHCIWFSEILNIRTAARRLRHMLWTDLVQERDLVSDSRNVSAIKRNYWDRNVGKRSHDWFVSITIFSNTACIHLAYKTMH